MSGFGNLIWRISVALYLLAVGVLGIQKGGHLADIFGKIFNNNTALLVQIAGVIALIAGVFLLLELFKIEIPILKTLVLILAIIWAIFIVLGIITGLGGNIWELLQRIGVQVMVCVSLFIASGKFS